MLKNLLSKKDRRLLISNFFNYTFFQASNYLIPIITVPYIIRVVGLEYFGLISLAQAVSNYLRVGVDYGWSILGVQYVATSQFNRKKISEVVSNIFMIQMILTLIGVLILIILMLFFPDLNKEKLLFLSAYGLVPANMMIAPWFYLGMERVKYLNLINFTARVIYLLLIFILLNNKNQYLLVPIFNSISLFMGGIISIYVIVNVFKVKIYVPNFRKIIKYLYNGWPIFISYFATNLYRNTNVIILALFTTKEILGIYSATEKIIKAVQGTFTPVTQTVYPFISRLTTNSGFYALKVIKNITLIMLVISGITMAFLIIGANFIIELILENPSQLGNILLKIGSFVILFGVLNYILGVIYMLNFGMKKQFSRAVVVTGIVGIIICFILSYFFQAIGTMISFAMAEGILLFILLGYVTFFKKFEKVNP